MRKFQVFIFLVLLSGAVQCAFATEDYSQYENGNFTGTPLRVDVTPTRITIYGTFTVEFEKRGVSSVGDSKFVCVSDPRYEITMENPERFTLTNTYTHEATSYYCKRTTTTYQDAIESTQEWGREMIRLNNEFLRTLD